MKRAGRIVNRLSGLSLLLLLATAGVWVRSYWVSDQLHWYDWPEDRAFFDEKEIWCSRGGIRFEAARYLWGSVLTSYDEHFKQSHRAAKNYPTFGDGWLDPHFFPEPRRYAALGFEWVPQSSVNWGDFSSIYAVVKSLTLPLYFPTLLFAILPAHVVLRLRRCQRRMARRLALGCCIACGYDLRASSGRCPECGGESSCV